MKILMGSDDGVKQKGILGGLASPIVLYCKKEKTENITLLKMNMFPCSGEGITVAIRPGKCSPRCTPKRLSSGPHGATDKNMRLRSHLPNDLSTDFRITFVFVVLVYKV
jgi:hypothetical protein